MKQSEKDKDNINENGFYDAEVSKLKCRLREDKQQIRQMYYDTLQKRKDLIEKHEGVIKLENSMRKMKELIDHSKNIRSSQSRINTSMAKPESVVTGKAWDLDEMRKKVEAAKRNMKWEQYNIDKGTKNQDDKINELQYQIKLLELKNKEKDKELSLATLKAKQLKRSLRYNSLKPLSSTPGQLTTRKMVTPKQTNDPIALRSNRNLSKNNIVNKRNSTEYTGVSSNKVKEKQNLTSSEIRLEKSESSIMSNDKKATPKVGIPNRKVSQR